MKKCTKCQQEKPLTEFWKTKKIKSGYWSSCKACYKLTPYIKNKGYREVSRKFYRTEKGQKWYKENQTEISRKWKTSNRDKTCASSAKRRALLSKATPKWLTEEMNKEILAMYTEAQKKGLQVDHIYPINGETCTGLHVPWNLQLLTKSENSSKKNRIPKDPIN